MTFPPTQTEQESWGAADKVILMTVTYGGGPTVKKYCSGTDSVDSFTAVPAFEYHSAEKNLSMLDEDHHMIVMPTSIEPFDSIYPNPKWDQIEVLIEDAVIDYRSKPTATTGVSIVANSRKDRWFGHIGPYELNPVGKAGLIECKINSIKDMMKLKVLHSADLTCQSKFGDNVCGATKLQEDATINALDVDDQANRVQITFTGSPSLTAKLWARGSVIVDGRGIGIRSFDGVDKFDLMDTPHSSWAGASCTVESGCDQTYTTCDTIHGNGDRFNAIGPSMRPVNPIYIS